MWRPISLDLKRKLTSFFDPLPNNLIGFDPNSSEFLNREIFNLSLIIPKDCIVAFKNTLSPFNTTVGTSIEYKEISTKSVLSPIPNVKIGILVFVNDLIEFSPSVIIPSEIIIAPAKSFSDSTIAFVIFPKFVDIPFPSILSLVL